MSWKLILRFQKLLKENSIDAEEEEEDDHMKFV